jgi:hypothetical protein
MQASRSLPSWLNSLIVVSLLMTLVSVPAQAAFPRTGESDRSSPRLRLRDVPVLVGHDSNPAVLPAWWASANDVSQSERDSIDVDVVSPQLQLTPMPTPMPEVLPTPARPSQMSPLPPLLEEMGRGLTPLAEDDGGESSKYNTGFTASGRGYSLEGMTAHYYDGHWLSGGLAATEVVATPIDFYLQCWEESPPYSGCEVHDDLADGNDYSVEWTGWLVVPASGAYEFNMEYADDAARMYLDGSLLVKRGQWDGEPSWEDIPTANRWLEAGAHWVILQYNQYIRYVVSMRIQWSGPGFGMEVIPVERAECSSSDDCCLNSACCANDEVGGEISTASGNHNYAVTDLRVAGIENDLVFRRTYASNVADRDAAGLGYGWTHNHAMALGLPPIGPTVYVDPVLGEDHIFCGAGAGEWACRTISYTLNYQAEYGDTVQAAPGIYTETFALRPGVTIQGAAGHSSIIHGGGTLGPLVTASGNDITSTSVLSGFKLIGAQNSTGDGGALYVSGASPRIVNNVVVSNTAADGGGLYLTGSSATLINNVVAGNQAGSTGNGSGLYVEASSLRLLHTTVARNTGGDGSGIYVGGNSTAALTNTILVSHTIRESVLDHGNHISYCAIRHIWGFVIEFTQMWG